MSAAAPLGLSRVASGSRDSGARHEIHGVPSRILRTASTGSDLPLVPKEALTAIREAVASVVWAAELSPELLTAVCHAFHELQFDAGAPVYIQHEPANTFYVIASGEFEAVSPDMCGDCMGEPWGSRQRHAPGECFGDEALLGDALARSQSVMCVATGSLWALEAAAFRHILADNLAAMQRKASIMSLDASDEPPRHARIGAVAMRDLVADGWLGDGAFGVVWRVTHSPSGTPFALKCMERRRVRRPQDADGVLRERHILGLLAQPEHAHALIVRAAAFYQDAEGLYMLLELISCGDLNARLGIMHTLPPDSAAFYAACTGAALLHLHSLNVVYRDLKPENLVVDHRGYLKLIDFGLSKVLGEGRTWTLCGTPHFMAPEIVRGRGYGLPADWWALGILVYEMLVGGCPFEGTTEVEIFKQLMATPRVVKYPSTLPADAIAFVQLLLTGAPSRRLGGEAIFEHAFLAPYEHERLLAKAIMPPAMGDAVKPTASSLDEPASPASSSRKGAGAATSTDEENSSSASSDDEKDGAAKHAGRAAPGAPGLPSWADFESWDDPANQFCGFASAEPAVLCP